MQAHTHTHTRKHRRTVPIIPLRAAFVWGQGDPVALGPVNRHNEGLSSCTHPAGCVGLTMGGEVKGRRVGLWEASQHPSSAVLKLHSGSPPEIALFTPFTDGAKSPLVTQSHAVNRWSCYWVKDRGSRGGSPSIPAGNNGAAGQECRLQEEGSGRRGVLRHSWAMRALWNRRNWESFGVTDRGEEARGYVQVAKFPGIRLRWRRIACESGTAVFVFNLQTRTKRHPYAHTFACSEENTDLQFNIHSKDSHLYSLISLQTQPRVKKSGPHFWSKKKRKYRKKKKNSVQWCFIDRKARKRLKCPEDIFFHKILMCILLKFVSSITKVGQRAF